MAESCQAQAGFRLLLWAISAIAGSQQFPYLTEKDFDEIGDKGEEEDEVRKQMVQERDRAALGRG